MDWLKALWNRTKVVAATYTWTFIVVITLNQLLFFGFCLNPVCIIAAMPHCLAITVFLGSILNNANGWGDKKEEEIKKEFKPRAAHQRKRQSGSYRAEPGPKYEPIIKSSSSFQKRSAAPGTVNQTTKQTNKKYENPNRSAINIDKNEIVSLNESRVKASSISSSNAPSIVKKTDYDRPGLKTAQTKHRETIRSKIRDQLQTKTKSRIREKMRNDMESHLSQVSNKISTSELGRVYGVKAKPYLFDYLVELGHIKKENKKYELTSGGINIGGGYKTNQKGERWVVWDKQRISGLVEKYKAGFVEKLPFHHLMHITHVDNLETILQHGLLPHNNKYQKKDISNQTVNDRRDKQESVFKHKLHDYVPFYMNVKNPMLYQVQKEYGDSVVILSLTKSICLNEKTVFSYGNAATSDADFLGNMVDVQNLNWDLIFSTQWSNNGIVNTEIKSKMMSECLVYGGVKSKDIVCINCPSHKTKSMVEEICRRSNIGAQIVLDRRFFFD